MFNYSRIFFKKNVILKEYDVYRKWLMVCTMKIGGWIGFVQKVFDTGA